MSKTLKKEKSINLTGDTSTRPNHKVLLGERLNKWLIGARNHLASE